MRAGKVAAALRRYLSGEKTRSAGGSSPKILIQESRVLTRCWRNLSVPPDTTISPLDDFPAHEKHSAQT
jgi:hypothetical protein